MLCLSAKASELVKIEGLTTVTVEDANKWIQPQITYIESDGVTMARADDIAYFLENAMRDRGYRDALVDWKLMGEGETRHILLSVSEGQPQLISSFEISGNEALADEAVIELLTDTTRKRLNLGPKDPVPLVKADLKNGQKRLDEFYTLLGFGDVSSDMEVIDNPGGAIIRVEIAEGREHVVGAISIPEAKSPAMAEEFEDIRSDFTGIKFNPDVTANLQSRILAVVVDAGYYEAVVMVSESSRTESDEGEVIALKAQISWGTMANISRINVTGNEKVTSQFFDHHFAGLVGQPLSPERTNESVEQLLQSGAFETVRTTPVKLEDGTFQLDVSVEESYSRTLGVYGGFTNYDGAIGGFEFRNLNLFGAVRSINAEIEFSKRGGKGAVEYVDPWFLNTDVEFRARLFGLNRSEDGYDKWETGLSYEFTRRFGAKKHNSVSLFGRAGYTDVYEAEIDPMFLGDTQYFVHFIGAAYTLDKRDRAQAPRKGYIARISTSIASSGIGSEEEFFRATGRLAFYQPVGKHTFRVSARAGTIQPIGNTNAIPIDLRYFNGGPNSVRSFQERALGPKDPSTGYSIGGEFFTVFNAEYEVPIGKIEGLRFVGFADAGNLLANNGDPSLDNLRYAVGAGLRYLTPVGPLRFEYGYNPDQQDFEPEGTFHAVFGFAF